MKFMETDLAKISELYPGDISCLQNIIASSALD